MSEIGVDKFFSIARKRYKLMLNRKFGEPRPWTTDPILQSEYFCNVFREDDKTTEWFRWHIRAKVQDDPKKALLAIAAFRWFNKIETGDKIKPLLLDNWDSKKAIELVANQKPIVTGAYIIKTPDGMDKLHGVLWCIDKFEVNMQNGMFDKILSGASTMEEACTTLKLSPYLGNFMAWQICSDARQTCLLKTALDKDTWAQPGPGSSRGLGRVFYGDVDHFNYGSKSEEKEMLTLMQDLSNCSKRAKYWLEEWPKLAVIDISHQLCEHDKYCRAEEGGRMKRKYVYKP